MNFLRYFPLLFLIGSVLAACGGGGSTRTSHTVTLSWTANRETAVNGPGGGYRVHIRGQAPIDVPYASPGPLAPTSVTTTLLSGIYSVTVVAYSALSPTGAGAGGSTSATSTPLTLRVP